MEYLKEDFDPKSLKVADLRKILNLHNVSYSSDDKKSKLISIFNDEIVPKRKTLLKSYEKKIKNVNDKDFIDATHNDLNSDEIIPDTEEETNQEITRESINQDITTESINQDQTISPKLEKESKTIKKIQKKKPKSSSKSDRSKKDKIEESANTSITSNKGKETKKDKAEVSINTSIASNGKEETDNSFSSENVFQSFDNSTASTSSKKRKHEENDDKDLKIKKKSTGSKSLKIKSPSNKSVDDSIKTETGQSDKSFKTIEEEIANFDENQERIRNKKEELARSLGINIQGFQPPKIENVSTPTSSSTPKKEIKLYHKTGGDEKTPAKSSPHVKKELKSTPAKSSPKIEKLRSDKVQTPVKSSPKVEKLKSKDVRTPDHDKKVTPLKIRLDTPNKKATPKRSPIITKSAITPKPRLISISSKAAESDEGDSDEELEKSANTIVPLSDKIKTPKSLKPILIYFLVWLSLIFIGIFGYWYHEQQYLVGYCGQEIDQITFKDSEYLILKKSGELLDHYFKPKCIHCPPNARCFPTLQIGCFEDYMEYAPWYEFLSPGHKKCIPDTKKAEKINIMIDVALDLLRSKNANVQCGKGSNDEESGISVNDLHDLLLSMKAAYITIEEFEELWNRSMVELMKEPDIIVRQVRTPTF
ncbi:unnamed protein product [Candida verbasci]|uniref:Inner nuclear membrane protein SRC1 n=1 Tax=Candida verbasci TaxID=1227364 RepID=A0A9W4XCG9_9ASCO|nr:unnamed protein product [Candida verbasci]